MKKLNLIETGTEQNRERIPRKSVIKINLKHFCVMQNNMSVGVILVVTHSTQRWRKFSQYSSNRVDNYLCELLT